MHYLINSSARSFIVCIYTSGIDLSTRKINLYIEYKHLNRIVKHEILH